MTDDKTAEAQGCEDLRRGLFIKTFGCQMNVYDSEKLARLLEEDYRPVPAAEDAELVIVNSCSVREKPEQKVYSLLGEWRRLKDRRPGLIIGVGGCVAQQAGERLLKDNGAVDFVFGTHNLSLVPALVRLRREGGPPQVAVDYRDAWEDLPLGLGGSPSVSAFVAISRGCSKRCSFCVVPITRGREISRAADEIEREVRLLLARGTREIVLLGQSVNSYGRDLRPRIKFEELLARLAQLSDLKRIRFTSPHPQEIEESFLDLIAGDPKICRHMHLPLQSGSSRVLRSMRRNYTQERYLEIAAALRARAPDISITTDIIVGFPGESDEDFGDTLQVLERVPFDSSYSFVFSPRPGTAAAELPGQLPEAVKQARLAEFQRRQDEITLRRLAQWCGRTAEILTDGPSRADPKCLQGRLSQNIVVNLAQACPDLQPGMLTRVRITEAGKHSLRGERP